MLSSLKISSLVIYDYSYRWIFFEKVIWSFECEFSLWTFRMETVMTSRETRFEILRKIARIITSVIRITRNQDSQSHRFGFARKVSFLLWMNVIVSNYLGNFSQNFTLRAEIGQNGFVKVKVNQKDYFNTNWNYLNIDRSWLF